MKAEPLCREQRRLMGLPYPRSSCPQCGFVLRPGWRCTEGIGNGRASPPKPSADPQPDDAEMAEAKAAMQGILAVAVHEAGRTGWQRGVTAMQKEAVSICNFVIDMLERGVPASSAVECVKAVKDRIVASKIPYPVRPQ